MSEYTLIKYKVTGTVQVFADVTGVNFRSSTKKEAIKLGLSGWVRNNADESVEGLAVGPSDKIQQFQSYLKQGPSVAKVDNVELLEHKQGLSADEAKGAAGGEGYEVK